MIAAREYVDFRIVVRNDGKGRFYSAWQAVEEGVGKKLLPESEGVVRGYNFVSGFMCESIGDGSQSKVCYMIRSDLRGTMSLWVVNKGLSYTLDSFVAAIAKQMAV
ncbi:hypothetical protein DFJ73DRAFT_870014, partial [Zopfochytrium polystomum]